MKRVFSIATILNFFLWFYNSDLILSQNSIDDFTQENYDTIYCIKYHFNLGDTLIYYLESYDSIIVDFEKPLLKQRFEEIQITCDSIKNKIFYLTYQLTNYLGFERQDEKEKVQRTSSPWIGKKILIAIDSLGNRYKLAYDDTLSAAVCPGGAFQPPLLIKLADSISCYKSNSFWFTESLDELVENAFPVPLVRQASLLRITGTIDTLGKHCVRINSIKTAQGSYNVYSQKDTIKISNVIAGAEILDLDTISCKIVHLTTTVEQKLSISIGNQEPKKGLHYIYTNYKLVDEKKRKNIKNKR